MSDLRVKLSPKETSDKIEEYVLREGFSTKCVGKYNNKSQDGKEIFILVFEKYFIRNSSRASLSVAIENINGETCVYFVGSGGGQGAIFGFDWGAGDSFSSLVEKAVEDYM